MNSFLPHAFLCVRQDVWMNLGGGNTTELRASQTGETVTGSNKTCRLVFFGELFLSIFHKYRYRYSHPLNVHYLRQYQS